MTIEVMLESEVTDAERAAVTEVFKLAGIQVDIQAAYIRRGWAFPPGSSSSLNVFHPLISRV